MFLNRWQNTGTKDNFMQPIKNKIAAAILYKFWI